MKRTIFVLAILPIYIFCTSAQDTTPAKKPHATTNQTKGAIHLSDVHRIFIADFTTSEHAELFRSLLSEKLTSKGFTIVETSGAADAMLIGNLSIEEEQGRNRVKASVMLFAGPANELWEGKSNLRQSGSAEQVLAVAAEALAERFSVAWQKDAKKRGVKVVDIAPAVKP
jgi:hypothetical protein